MISRRDFLKFSVAAGAGLFLTTRLEALAAADPKLAAQLEAQLKRRWALSPTYATPTLDPLTIPKYVDPLIIPPEMVPAAAAGPGQPYTLYEIAVRQFNQQILPSGGLGGDPGAAYPATTVWGYGKAGDPIPGGTEASSFNSPAFTIETRRDQKVRVEWINHLVDDPNSAAPQYLPHLFPVDQTLHWANPPGPIDSHTMPPTAQSYTGPVPTVSHVHGAHTKSTSDGYPEAWYLPAAANLPAGIFTKGSRYATIGPETPGRALFEYPNDTAAATTWYHDHALGITRLNVYAGMAGFWLHRDDVEDALNLPGPAPKVGDPPGTQYYEIPIAIQDRSFNDDGSLFYPDSRLFFDADDYMGPFIPDGGSDVSPIWNPEFFGNAMMVNGRTWPYLEVEPRKYRLRFLNGCNSRFLVMKFDQPLSFTQIGAEGGWVSGAPVVVDQLLMAPAERADCIVDFSSFTPGDEIVLQNFGPDAPFGGFPIEMSELADPNTTGQVMKFVVVPLSAPDTSEVPASLPAIVPLGAPDVVRDVTLNEEMSAMADVPIHADLGTGAEGALGWDDELTEICYTGDVEEWRVLNLTGDAHPIHIHINFFQVLGRRPFNAAAYQAAQNLFLVNAGPKPDPLDYVTGPERPPESWESGWKDTLIAYPDEITRLAIRFDIPGLTVWHCHILEHEDNEMMRPLLVLEKTHLPFIANGEAPPAEGD